MAGADLYRSRLRKAHGTRSPGPMGRNAPGTAGSQYNSLTRPPPPTTGVPPTTPPVPGTPGGAAPPPGPLTWQGFSDTYRLDDPQEYTTARNYLQSNLDRLNPIDTPSYEEMFQRYQDVANRVGDDQVAQLRETYGSRGARYSSAIADAEGKARADITERLGVQAGELGMAMNRDRMTETAGTLDRLTNIGTSRLNVSENAAQRAWADYLRRTSPSPYLDALMNYSTSFNPPGNIVY